MILETSLIDTEGVGTKSTCVRGADARNTSFAQSAYVKDAFVSGACAESTYAGDASTIKQLGMDLQSLQISKVKLFGTSLKIGVRAC